VRNSKPWRLSFFPSFHSFGMERVRLFECFVRRTIRWNRDDDGQFLRDLWEEVPLCPQPPADASGPTNLLRRILLQGEYGEEIKR
jgi:hypothetical protein